MALSPIESRQAGRQLIYFSIQTDRQTDRQTQHRQEITTKIQELIRKKLLSH